MDRQHVGMRIYISLLLQLWITNIHCHKERQEATNCPRLQRTQQTHDQGYDATTRHQTSN
jgi:hypothetical protein